MPAGFCVTTDAFDRIMTDAPSIDERLERLARVEPRTDQESIRSLSADDPTRRRGGHDPR